MSEASERGQRDKIKLISKYKVKYKYLFSCDCSDMLEALCSVDRKHEEKVLKYCLKLTENSHSAPNIHKKSKDKL